MKISVITTTYNRKDLLRQTIESVQKSILTPLTDVMFEHIIYDDASTDGTEEMAAAGTWSNVMYIRGEENKGPSCGRNRAIERSTGEYIFLIDSDDILLQKTLYKFARAAQAQPDRDWFIGDFLRVDGDLRYIIGEDYYVEPFKDTAEVLTSIFKGDRFMQSSVFFSRKLFDAAGGFDETMHMGEDLDLFIRFLLQGSMPVVCDLVTHLHRFHDSNLSVGITKDKHTKLVEELRLKYAGDTRATATVEGALGSGVETANRILGSMGPHRVK